jgi:hypothetical protein
VPCTDDEHAVNRRVEFDVKVKWNVIDEKF